jgi:hypothetical protein
MRCPKTNAYDLCGINPMQLPKRSLPVLEVRRSGASSARDLHTIRTSAGLRSQRRREMPSVDETIRLKIRRKILSASTAVYQTLECRNALSSRGPQLPDSRDSGRPTAERPMRKEARKTLNQAFDGTAPLPSLELPISKHKYEKSAYSSTI